MLDKARHHSNRCMQDSFKYAKERWDKIHKPPDFKIGDLVLVSSLKFNNIRGPNKSEDSFAGLFMTKALHGPNAVQSTIFSEIDLYCACNLLIIEEGGEHFTASRTKHSSYYYLVFLFGLTNAPSSFQNYFNDIFSDCLDIFVVVYSDDIMIFSISEEEHLKHVASVIQRLRENNLSSKASNV
ncbi:hypothetical protein O181_074354 [Austropuccinia psidii MF-1]|uniref:Reverse transcriptase domain-containing protein n=1 Tax=Austropuccinia psidii MF-1 TaxID=1389203 RepID=A0A9Q3IDD9_9BASI|nr:hypothetical protein [Austropuccinia psidii MF-1]